METQKHSIPSKIFITGIDTDIGKTIAVGLMAGFLARNGRRVITQKMVQTGCEDMAEDILTHRKLMGCGLLDEDKSGLTCPYLFRHPASPHLAAEMETRKIEPEKILAATQKLAERYETVLIEGAGGLFVPLNSRMLIIDYIKNNSLPVILVSSSRLGSINHTLLSMEAISTRGIPLMGIVYNRYGEADPAIGEDSLEQIKYFMGRAGSPDRIVQLGELDPDRPAGIDFSPIFNAPPT